MPETTFSFRVAPDPPPAAEVKPDSWALVMFTTVAAAMNRLSTLVRKRPVGKLVETEMARLSFPAPPSKDSAGSSSAVSVIR